LLAKRYVAVVALRRGSAEVPRVGDDSEEADMNRGFGSGSMAFGAVLAVVGAIMRYAVDVNTDGFNIHIAGVILLVVGIGMILFGLIAMVLGGRSRTTRQESVENTPGGQVRTSEQDVRASF
jgi:hypothetical protein